MGGAHDHQQDRRLGNGDPAALLRSNSLCARRGFRLSLAPPHAKAPMAYPARWIPDGRRRICPVLYWNQDSEPFEFSRDPATRIADDGSVVDGAARRTHSVE